MSNDQSTRPNRGGRRRRGGGGNRRRGPRNRNFKNNPAPKETGILAYIKKLLGLGPKKSHSAKPEKDRNGSTAPKSERPAREPREPREPRAPRESKPEAPQEVLTTKLYVGNLAYETSESDLYDLFANAGSVANVEVVRDGRSNSKGFGFVEMSSLETAKAAAEKYHRSDFMGRQIVVAGAKK